MSRVVLKAKRRVTIMKRSQAMMKRRNKKMLITNQRTMMMRKKILTRRKTRKMNTSTLNQVRKLLLIFSPHLTLSNRPQSPVKPVPKSIPSLSSTSRISSRIPPNN